MTFTVNSADDIDDGTCNLAHCSLREAIDAANANVSTDTIEFGIPGAGPHTIQPNSALPAVTDPVAIDGYTQPGASPNTNGPDQGTNATLLIELDGSNAGTSVDGLRLHAGNTTVRGLVINQFSGGGILMTFATDGSNTIEGNFIGTDVPGMTDLGNSENGVHVLGPNNLIGGTAPAARNIISGNSFGISMGCDITAGFTTNNLVQGNLIGTDATGTSGLGNELIGVGTCASSNSIGGAATGAGNVISGNGRSGVQIAGIGLGLGGNVIQGNLIGAEVAGTSPLPNGQNGIVIFDNTNTLVGGATAEERNIIAFNSGDGIGISGGGHRNRISHNSIYDNAGLGIDLYGNSGTGVGCAPFPGGASPNDCLPFPTLVTIGSGKVVGDACSLCVIELFLADDDPANNASHGEGAKFIGSDAADGDGNFSIVLPCGLDEGLLTATATDTDGNTSEFSENLSFADTAPCAVGGVSFSPDLGGSGGTNPFWWLGAASAIVALGGAFMYGCRRSSL